MARIDMVRSYLEKLAAAAWPESVVDENQTVLIRSGSALVQIIVMENDPEWVGVISVVAKNVPATPALFEWLNERNRRTRQVKLLRSDRESVQAVVWVPTDEINEATLTRAVEYLGSVADELDDKLVASLGGELPSPPPSST